MTAMEWVHNKFGTGTCDKVGEINVGVSDNLAIFFDDQMSVVLIATMTEVENYVFGNRRNSIVLGGGRDQRQHTVLLDRVEMFEMLNQLLNALCYKAFFCS